jgi:hypothetical protein
VAGVYSVRFLRVIAAGVWVQYTVPAGRRAVVRCVAVGSNNAAGGSAIVQVAGVKTNHLVLPGAGARTEETRLVAYTGEIIEMLITGATTYGSISGYLFLDPSNAKAPEVTRELELQVDALPAPADAA